MSFMEDEATADVMMAEYVREQREWSERTFGPGKRTIGITEHIKKELREIRQDPSDVSEWIDVAILAFDGYWRAGGDPLELMEMLRAKQKRNFQRQWPAPQPEDMPTEHIHGSDPED